MFKYSSLFNLMYLFSISYQLVKLIINKQDISNNIVFFMFAFIIVPMYVFILEYFIRIYLNDLI